MLQPPSGCRIEVGVKQGKEKNCAGNMIVNNNTTVMKSKEPNTSNDDWMKMKIETEMIE